MSAAAGLPPFAELVGRVAAQALAARGADRVALLDDGSPEAELAARVLSAALGAGAVLRVTAADRTAEALAEVLRERAGTRSAAAGGDAAAEIRRLLARLERGALVANPANKSALLLGGPLPPEPLLPLGDVYASEVDLIVGAWSAPPAVQALADAAGGIDRLDAALRQRIDRRDPRGLELLEPAVRLEVEAALARGRASRVFGSIVPKLGPRTLGVDLFE